MSFSLTSLPHWIYRRLDIDRRRSPDRSGPVTLAQSRVFILPTRSGMILASLLIGLLVVASNFSSNELFLLTFLLIALVMVTMVHTYRNLLGLNFLPGHEKHVFCGNAAVHTLHAENPSGTPRMSLAFSIKDGDTVSSDLGARHSNTVTLSEPTLKRGRQPMPEVTISSRFPLGLFRVWSRIRLTGSCLVYPRPAETPPSPATSSGSPNAPLGTETRSGNEDFSGHRTYQTGDPPRHVDWKALARSDNWLTKQFSSHERDEIWLDWHQLIGIDIEKRLEILCRWVLDAEADTREYGLILPGKRIPPARGDAHKHRCLTQLALFENAPHP